MNAKYDQRIRRRTLLLMAGAGICASCVPPSWGAEALIHPSRHPVRRVPTREYENVVFTNGDIALKCWLFRSERKRGTAIYLHGVGDNRQSGIGIADHFVPKGYDVLLYDSRAHGESGGSFCTYGFYEKFDLSKIINSISAQPIILFGVSMGAAVALQTTARDPRISAVIAVACFSDLRSAAMRRAPFFMTKAKVEQAFRLAEAEAQFVIDDVSPAQIASMITTPVLLVHGAADRETPASDSQRIYTALNGRKQLVLVPGKGHNDSVNGETWNEIDSWVEQTASR